MYAPEFSDLEVSIYQEYQDQGVQVVGISNEPIPVIEAFIADQGITFPVLWDNQGVYGQYNIPGGQSPYPRDYLVDAEGILRLTNTEYDPGLMISVLENLLDSTTAATQSIVGLIPSTPRLYPSYPNPFNPATILQFSLPTSTMTHIAVHDLFGRVVATPLPRQALPAGTHRLTWDGRATDGTLWPSGIYLIVLATDQIFAAKKLSYYADEIRPSNTHSNTRCPDLHRGNYPLTHRPGTGLTRVCR